MAAVIISTVYGFQTSVKIASAMTQIIIAANLLLLRTYLLVLPLFLKVCGDQLSAGSALPDMPQPLRVCTWSNACMR